MPYPALHVRGRVRVFRKKKRARGTFPGGEEACPLKWGKRKIPLTGSGIFDSCLLFKPLWSLCRNANTGYKHIHGEAYHSQ